MLHGMPMNNQCSETFQRTYPSIVLSNQMESSKSWGGKSSPFQIKMQLKCMKKSERNRGLTSLVEERPHNINKERLSKQLGVKALDGI